MNAKRRTMLAVSGLNPQVVTEAQHSLRAGDGKEPPAAGVAGSGLRTGTLRPGGRFLQYAVFV